MYGPDGSGCNWLRFSPSSSTGAATTSPATGPAAPTASRCRLLRNGTLAVITAPSVPNGPIGYGIGMKYGRLVGLPSRRATR